MLGQTSKKKCKFGPFCVLLSTNRPKYFAVHTDIKLISEKNLVLIIVNITTIIVVKIL